MKAPEMLLYIIAGNHGISDRLRAHELSPYAQDVLTPTINDHENCFLNSLIGWETIINLILLYINTRSKNACIKKVIYP
jgi:hypothetical protein